MSQSGLAMKNKEKKHLASQFPNIYRNITESKNVQSLQNISIRLLNQPKVNKLLTFLSIIFVFLVVIILVLEITVFSFGAFRYYDYYRQISLQRENLQSQINFWQSIADRYDGYKDAYFRIALLEYRLGDLQKAKVANAKALILDPNFDDAKKLEVILDKK